MVCRRVLGWVFVAAMAAPVLAAQSGKAPVIPEFPGSTTPSTTTPSTTTSSPSASPAASPAVTQAPAATPENVAPASAEPANVPVVKPMTKEQQKAADKAARESEKAAKKAEKEKAKKEKEAKQDSDFLKMQGDELMAQTLDADGKPIVLKPCHRKDKVCQKKRKELLKRKTVALKVTNGQLTVDGWAGKARLVYDINDVKFLYFSSPGLGTVIVSMQPFPGSKEEKEAFKEKTLTVSTPDGHQVQLSSEKPLLSKKQPESAWVSVDPTYVHDTRYPAFGYGASARAPYNWPGVRPLTDEEKKMISKAPPLPKGLEAKVFELPCVNLKPGETPKAVKINGIMMTPKPCAKPEGTEQQGYAP